MLVYDEDNLARVAKIVIKYNHYLKGSSVESVVKRMKATAESTNPDHGYITTGGFCLSFYLSIHGNGDVGVYASIAEHCFT